MYLKDNVPFKLFFIFKDFFEIRMILLSINVRVFKYEWKVAIKLNGQY